MVKVKERQRFSLHLPAKDQDWEGEDTQELRYKVPQLPSALFLMFCLPVLVFPLVINQQYCKQRQYLFVFPLVFCLETRGFLFFMEIG